MVRTVERIEQELAVLDQAVEKMAQDFRDVYSQYLSALGQAVKQQLILATYHLCTQGYPERFLSLSLQQRQQLQQSLRQLTQQSQQRFLEMLNASQHIENAPPRRRSAIGAALLELSQIDLGEASLNANGELEILSSNLSVDDLTDLKLAGLDLANADLTELPEADLTETDLAESPAEHESPFSADQEPDFSAPPEPSDSQTVPPPMSESSASEPEAPTVAELLQEGIPSAIAAQPDRPSEEGTASLDPSPSAEAAAFQPPPPPEPMPLHPRQLALWQEQLEDNIIEELQNLSHTANRLLQKSQILPSRLPEPVLEVAAKADLSAEVSSSPPNLLNLIIETETEESKESSMTQLMAVRLRLSEIEFSDSSTMVWRSKVRELLAHLNKLGREYQKKQKERSIAQAEAAWRSSWYEEQE